ncbi:hypothetical protein [Streptomyces chartreusis]|uniref:hypothetical protein n=1 Tax=Streptomyces chartreusis TaxID=1969 RepID=UPI0038106EA4
MNQATFLDEETGASRYTSHDELKNALRSLTMYDDFVRHIYLVTDGQKPQWLDDTTSGITVVDHRDIFPADALPLFQPACTIYQTFRTITCTSTTTCSSATGSSRNTSPTAAS